MAVSIEKSTRLLPSILAAIVLGTLTIYITRGTHGVHLPLLVGGLSGLAIGFISPKKGWIAAIIQAGILLIGVAVVKTQTPIREIELHSLIGALGLTFVGSFIGAFIKRAFDN